MSEISVLDLQNLRHLIGGFDTCHCKMQDYEKQIEAFYGKIQGIEIAIAEFEQRRTGIRRRAITVDNVYKYLIYFDSVYTYLSRAST